LLSLDSYTSKPSASLITSTGVSLLPPTLTSLSLGKNVAIAVSALRSLPSKLTSLMIEGKLQKPSRADKSQTPPFFPPGLTELIVNVKPVAEARSREWLNLITRDLPPTLQVLEFNDGPSDDHQANTLAFESLPSTLKSLRVPQRRLHSSVLERLPSALNQLLCVAVPWLDSNTVAKLESNGVALSVVAC